MPRILLADDNITAQNMGKKILSAAGYDVITVSNGLAAMNAIAKQRPDIALLDVYMPGYTGIEICENIKAAPEMDQISVLLTVGKMEPFRAEEGMKVKADGFVVKPFEARNLITAVEELRRAHPPNVAVVPHIVAHEPSPGAYYRSRSTDELQASNAVTDTTQVQLQETPVEPLVAEGTTRSAGPHQGGEMCDVCGFLNRQHAFVCEQCDVPLPSSVMSWSRGPTA